MKLHFAAEVVLVLMMRLRPGIEKIGAHISRRKARLDFILDEPISSLFPRIEEMAKEVIEADLPIISAFSDESRERRYWEVEGFGSLPCGGIHLSSTKEIGPIRLSRKNIGKGKERIEISSAEDRS